MIKIEKTSPVSHTWQPDSPQTTHSVALFRPPNVNPIENEQIMTRLTQRASAESPTNAVDPKSLALKSQRFQPLDSQTQNLILELIGNVDVSELGQPRLSLEFIESAIINATKLIESEQFKNAFPSVQREMLNAFSGQVNSSFLISNLMEIAGTRNFHLLDQHSQEVIVRQIGLAVSSNAYQTEAQAEIDNTRRLIESNGFSSASSAVRAKMLDATSLTKNEITFTNILIEVTGDSDQFGRLSESQKYKYIDRIKELYDKRWASRLFVAPVRGIIKENFGERWAKQLTDPLREIVEEVNNEISNALSGNYSRTNDALTNDNQ